MSQIIFLSFIIILILCKLKLNHKIIQKLNNNEDVTKMKRQDDILDLITNSALFCYILTRVFLSSLPFGIFIFTAITTFLFISINIIKLFKEKTVSLLLIELITITILMINYILIIIMLLYNYL